MLPTSPGDRAAANRLAELLEKDGHPAEAQRLRRKQAENDLLQARYEKLYVRNQPLRDGAEMARIAEQLGRNFEARGFLIVAASAVPVVQTSGATAPERSAGNRPPIWECRVRGPGSCARQHRHGNAR